MNFIARVILETKSQIPLAVDLMVQKLRIPRRNLSAVESFDLYQCPTLVPKVSAKIMTGVVVPPPSLHNSVPCFSKRYTRAEVFYYTSTLCTVQ